MTNNNLINWETKNGSRDRAGNRIDSKLSLPLSQSWEIQIGDFENDKVYCNGVSDKIIVTLFNNSLKGISLENGEIIWSKELENREPHIVLYDQNKMYIDGTLFYSKSLEIIDEVKESPIASIILKNDYFSCMKNKVIRSSDQEIIWKSYEKNPIALDEKYIYLKSYYDDKFYLEIYDPESQEVLYKGPELEIDLFAIAEDRYFSLTPMDKKLNCYSLDSFEKLWSHEQEFLRFSNSIKVCDNIITCLGSENNLLLIDYDGNLLQEIKVPDRISINQPGWMISDSKILIHHGNLLTCYA